MLPRHENKPVKRLQATLPDPLAHFVGEITGEGGLYETPTEFVRDLIRRYMEKTQQEQTASINAMLAASVREGRYSKWTAQDAEDIRQEIDS